MTERAKFTAFEVAAAALLARYGTLDVKRMAELGADEVELGAAVNVAAAELDPERVKAAGEIASPMVKQHLQRRRAADS